MPVEGNVELMRRWFQEVWNENKSQTIYELLSPMAWQGDNPEAKTKFMGPRNSLALWNTSEARFRISK